MKTLIILNLLLCNFIAISQSPDFNLQKYWFNRERFKQFFVSVGTNPGQSIAIPARSDTIKCKANQVVNFDYNYPKALKLNDVTAHQGWYLSVLATEYALLDYNNRSKGDLVYEIYCALYALNRLDMTEAHIGNTDLDGFLIREYFPSDFLEQHPELTATNLTEEERSKWNTNIKNTNS